MKSSISSLGSSFSGDSQLMITQIHIIKDKDTFGLQNKADSFLRNSLDNQDGGKKQMLTEMGSKIHTPIKDNFLSRRIRAMKAQATREKTHEMKRRNESIFYNRENRLRIAKIPSDVSCPTIRKVSPILQKEGEYQIVPFMMRKRASTLSKEMKVIASKYEESLQHIEERKRQKKLQYFDQQRKLISRVKGTKLYYQLARPWDHKRIHEGSL